MQQLVLGRCQLHRLPLANHPPMSEIDFQPARTKNRLPATRCIRTPQIRADSCQQLTSVERLGHVVIRPAVQRLNLFRLRILDRSEEHTSELQSHSFISYAVFCLKKKK